MQKYSWIRKIPITKIIFDSLIENFLPIFSNENERWFYSNQRTVFRNRFMEIRLFHSYLRECLRVNCWINAILKNHSNEICKAPSRLWLRLCIRNSFPWCAIGIYHKFLRKRRMGSAKRFCYFIYSLVAYNSLRDFTSQK